MTQREIKSYVADGKARDVTTAELDMTRSYREIGISYGRYGMNGGLFQDRETGELLAVTARCTNLFRLA